MQVAAHPCLPFRVFTATISYPIGRESADVLFGIGLVSRALYTMPNSPALIELRLTLLFTVLNSPVVR